MRPEIHLIIAAIMVSFIGILTKLIGTDVHPLVIGFYRTFFGLIVLAIICPIIDKSTFKPKKKDFGMYAVVGLVFAVIFIATCFAYTITPVQNIVLITSSTPLFVLLFAYFMLKEKITLKKAITFVIATIGIIIINPAKADGGIGNLIALGLALLGGLMVVLMRKEDTNHTIGDVFWFLFFATIFALPFPIIFGFGKIGWEIIAIGFLSTGLAYLFYNLALEKIEADLGSLIFNIIVPIVAVMLALTLLKEKFVLNVIIGGIILIISGIYLKLKINLKIKIKKIKNKKKPHHILLLHHK